jgi:hypothetical protein
MTVMIEFRAELHGKFEIIASLKQTSGIDFRKLANFSSEIFFFKGRGLYKVTKKLVCAK